MPKLTYALALLSLALGFCSIAPQASSQSMSIGTVTPTSQPYLCNGQAPNGILEGIFQINELANSPDPQI
ncbi:MAG TPA: hypothetical protein VMF10_07710 [Candidatus Aquilonibacter sp.]|nr:hypothetical protein [Candidatus Aquilonibacter sp.]